MPVPDPTLDAALRLELTQVETAPYATLNLVDLVFPFWTVSHVVEGDVVTASRGTTFPAPPGSVMVHPPGIPFGERSRGPGVHQWMALTATLSAPLRADLLDGFPLPPVVPLGRFRATYAEAFPPLERAFREPPSLRRSLGVLRGTAGLLELLIDAWREVGSPPRPEELRGPSERFAPLVAYMETHLSVRMTREDLARRACLHPGSLDRAFRAAYGVPPMRLLQILRMERARQLLETTERTLESVAIEVGLGDASRLSRLFRARYGAAPGALRASRARLKVGYPSADA